MAVTVTHTFVSAIADDPASALAGEVLPSHWNDDHAVSGAAAARTVRVVTAAGGVTIDADDDHIVVINKTVGEATAVTLPAAADAENPITIKDGKGDSDDNNITIDADGTEEMDGATSIVIDSPYAGITLYPYPNGTGWFVL
jgi:hypothetical protein